MSIASKAAKKAGSSSNRPDYKASFLRDTHRLRGEGICPDDSYVFEGDYPRGHHGKAGGGDQCRDLISRRRVVDAQIPCR